MKYAILYSVIKKISFVGLLFLFSFKVFATTSTSKKYQQDSIIKYHIFKGKVIDSKTKKKLIFASIQVNKTNISTITNTQGGFILKVPNNFRNNTITVSYLGYTSKVLSLSKLKNKSIIKLETYIEELSEVNLSIKDAQNLVKEVLRRKDQNYINKSVTMTAFYRETIKKRRTYVSLSEAVVKINKQPYTSFKNDIAKLYQSRKSTDYSKLDTVAFKLKGGPYNNLYTDIIKNSGSFFSENFINNYKFTYDKSTKIDNKKIYVVNFKQYKNIDEPLFYGKLFIDAQSLALVKATFDLNLDNKYKASKIFIVKKPRKAFVYPVKASYQVDYRVKNGKWYYGYSRIELGFKINWDKKIFNTIYYTTMEMAITDWEMGLSKSSFKPKYRMKHSIIMSDEASGFSDPNFWGAYNVIEPEKSIENAIKKIKKHLDNN